MNQQERESTAAMLIEAVRVNHNGAYEKWKSLENAEAEDYSQWIKDVLGLKQAPSEEDLRAMHEHSRSTLKDRINDMRNAHPEGPVCAGTCIAED